MPRKATEAAGRELTGSTKFAIIAKLASDLAGADVDLEAVIARGCLMIRDAEFWQRALAASRYAQLAANEQDKAAWLRIAEGFMDLFRKRQAEEEALYGASLTNNSRPNESVSLN